MKLNNVLKSGMAAAIALALLPNPGSAQSKAAYLVHNPADNTTREVVASAHPNDPNVTLTTTGKMRRGFYPGMQSGTPLDMPKQAGPNPFTDGGYGVADVFGTDDRTQVSSTTSFPNSARCFLVMNWHNGTQSYGSGNMIDKDHVLTAGHCVYNSSRGGWADSVIVYPGRNGTGNMSNFSTWAPFGLAVGTHYMSWKGWTNSGNWDDDMGVIELGSAIGNSTYWYGFASVSDNEGAGATIGGYPGDKPTATQWYDSDPIQVQTTNHLYYWIDTQDGESGSGLYRFFGSDRYIVGVHAYGGAGYWGKTYNAATRLTSGKFDDIEDFIY
ncbi:MAG: trypsin-like serine protease [Armatimonadetes bacterium]|nr:trypsin-like serine protease [Armatimonadota bacterium]